VAKDRRATRMPCCQGITEKKDQCTRTGTTHYEGKWYCKSHLRIIKSQEQCPICLEDMKKGSAVDVCGNGHYYHKDCMSKCKTVGVCPTCKRQITMTASVKVFEETDKLARMELANLKPEMQKSIMNMNATVLKCGQAITSYEIDELEAYMRDITKLKVESRCMLISIMNQFINHSLQNYPLEGIYLVAHNGNVVPIPDFTPVERIIPLQPLHGAI